MGEMCEVLEMRKGVAKKPQVIRHFNNDFLTKGVGAGDCKA